MKKSKQADINKKIIEGLDKVYQKVVDFKKQKQTDLVILSKENKLIKVKP